MEEITTPARRSGRHKSTRLLPPGHHLCALRRRNFRRGLCYKSRRCSPLKQQEKARFSKPCFELQSHHAGCCVRGGCEYAPFFWCAETEAPHTRTHSPESPPIRTLAAVLSCLSLSSLSLYGSTPYILLVVCGIGVAFKLFQHPTETFHKAMSLHDCTRLQWSCVQPAHPRTRPSHLAQRNANRPPII